MRPAEILKAQWRFYWRYGTIAVAIAMAAIEGFLLSFLPPPWNARLAAAFMLADSGVLGFFFLGALSILERQQGVSRVLHVLPRGRLTVLSMRVVFFSALAFFLAAGIGLAAGCGIASLPMAAATAAGAVLFSILGDALSMAAPSLNAYYLIGGLSLVPGLAGILPLFGLDLPFLAVSPSWGAARTISIIMGERAMAIRGGLSAPWIPLQFLAMLALIARFDAGMARRSRREAS
jgi:fluoroquinolone transport system permease protein